MLWFKSCLIKTDRKPEKIPRQKNFVGTVLMNLSKAFDCIPHDLLAAELHAYGLSEVTVTFTHSYLKRRKRCKKKWH